MKKFVFTDNKKLFNRVLAGAIAFILLLVVVTSLFVVDSFASANPKCYHKFFLSTFNGSYDKEGMPSTYWQVNAYTKEETGEALPVKVQVELPIQNRTERYLGQIWINVSDFKGDKVEIFTYRGENGKNKALNKDDKPYVLTANAIKESKDGWFKVYDYKNTDKYIQAYQSVVNYAISFSNEIRIREIVFVDTADVVIKGANQIEEYIGNLKNQFENSNPAKNAVDEYELFDVNKIKR